MNGKPSYLTSTTAIAFLLTIVGFMGYCYWTKNTDGMMKLVEMIVPAYLMTKGVAMGKNSQASLPKPENPPTPPVVP